MTVWGDVFDKYRRRGYDLSYCAWKADIRTKGESDEMKESYDIRVEMVEKYRGVEYWVAIDDQRYDCDCDQDGFIPNYAQATANSKWDAVRQLIDQLEEEESQ